jgi:hypothetical protein
VVGAFGPRHGLAIIQIAEFNSSPQLGVLQRVSYSWRLWSLVDNREEQLLQQCSSPFEPFRGHEKES